MIASRGRSALVALWMAGCGAVTGLQIDGSGTGGDAGASSSTGTSSNPLIGTWVASLDSMGTNAIETFILEADGTETDTVVYSDIDGTGCTGMIEQTGVTWTSTPTTVTFDTSASPCTGTITCVNSGGGGPCVLSDTPPTTCDYTLSDGDDKLVMTCMGDTVTFMRQH
jgi:hypothetical protein